MGISTGHRRRVSLAARIWTIFPCPARTLWTFGLPAGSAGPGRDLENRRRCASPDPNDRLSGRPRTTPHSRGPAESSRSYPRRHTQHLPPPRNSGHGQSFGATLLDETPQLPPGAMNGRTHYNIPVANTFVEIGGRGAQMALPDERFGGRGVNSGCNRGLARGGPRQANPMLQHELTSQAEIPELTPCDAHV